MEAEAQTQSLKEGSAAKRGRESSGKKVSQVYSLLVLKYLNLGTTISNEHRASRRERRSNALEASPKTTRLARKKKSFT